MRLQKAAVLIALAPLAGCGSSEPFRQEAAGPSSASATAGVPLCTEPRFKANAERKARADAEGGMSLEDGDTAVVVLPGEKCEIEHAPSGWSATDRLVSVDR